MRIVVDKDVKIRERGFKIRMFKKITAIGVSALMLGLTMGTAAAASFPSPFSGQAASGVAVVTGSGSGVDDGIAAGDISSYLASRVSSSGTTTVSGGDSFKLEKANNKFNLGNAINNVYTSIDERELPVVLAEGTYTNDANNDFEFQQSIAFAGTSLTLTHFRETNDEFSGVYVPIIGFDLSNGNHILNYTLKFTPNGADAESSTTTWSSGNKLETSEIEMLGKKYYVLTARNTTAANHKLTLLDTANSISMSPGESLTVGGHEVSINFLGSSSEIKFEIDGVITNTLEEGETQKLSDGSYIAVKDILFNSATGAGSVDFSIGSGKIELENGLEVRINGDEVSDPDDVTSKLTAYLGVSGDELDTITLKWDMTDNDWLVSGEDLVLPGFETIKLSMGSFNIPELEVLNIDPSSSGSVNLNFEAHEGSVNTFGLLHLNSSETAIGGLGEEDSLNKLVVNSTAQNSIRVVLNTTENSYFAATWISGQDAETYIYELKSITSSTNETKLDNLAVGGTDITLDGTIGDSDFNGELTIALTAINDAQDVATLTLTRTSGSGTLYADRIVTKGGLQFLLPQIDDSSNANTFINTTVGFEPTTFVLQFTEEDKDDNIASGVAFNVTLTVDTSETTIEPTSTTVSTFKISKTSDIQEGYVVSDIATKVSHDKSSDTNTLDVMYPGAESFAEVYISEFSVTVSGIEAGSLVMKDTEKSSWSNRHVVLVGGSCINSATAEALGVSTGTCAADFTSATGVGSGEYMIKSVGNAFTSGKIALVVAGYDKADTIAAASKLINSPNEVDTTSGKEYRGKTGVVGTSAFTEVA